MEDQATTYKLKTADLFADLQIGNLRNLRAPQ
jgi:hypothetical protein